MASSDAQLQNFVLRVAAESEIDELANISGRAFMDDSHTLLKAQFDGADAHRDGMKAALEQWFANPRYNLIVACGKTEQTPLGWVVWSRAGDNNNTEPEPNEKTPPRPEKATFPHTITGLKALTNSYMSYATALIMTSKPRCRYIVAINVDPDWQGHGIGSALIKWGTTQADADGVISWVSSSMGGRSAFRKFGFEETERLELRLDEYCENTACPGKSNWGDYVWTWMTRRPGPT